MAACVRGSCLLVGLALVLPQAASALPGDLDSGFGAGGAVERQVGPTKRSASTAFDLAILKDGTIVTVGHTTDKRRYKESVLAAFSPSGRLLRGLGERGVLLRQLGSGSGPYSSTQSIVALPKDDFVTASLAGRTVEVGRAKVRTDVGKRVVVQRFDRRGQLRRRFGIRGKVIIRAAAGATISGAEVVADRSGHLYLSYGGKQNGETYILVKRLRPDGSLDRGFGNSGTFVAPAGWTNTASAIDRAGRLLLTGLATGRVTSGGQVDTSFGSAGSVSETPGGEPLSEGTTVLPQADGSIVVVGTALGTEYAPYVARYSASGALINRRTYGSFRQYFEPNVYANSQALDAVTQQDGKIIFVGIADSGRLSPPPTVYELVGRANSDLSLDGAFGSGGVVRSAFKGDSGIVYAVARDRKGRLVTAGSEVTAHHRDGSATSVFSVARYLP